MPRTLDKPNYICIQRKDQAIWDIKTCLTGVIDNSTDKHQYVECICPNLYGTTVINDYLYRFKDPEIEIPFMVPVITALFIISSITALWILSSLWGIFKDK